MQTDVQMYIVDVPKNNSFTLACLKALPWHAQTFVNAEPPSVIVTPTGEVECFSNGGTAESGRNEPPTSLAGLEVVQGRRQQNWVSRRNGSTASNINWVQRRVQKSQQI
jgi:hypothetical protein